MEVYFKELISKDASLNKLVDDLQRVVQGVDQLAVVKIDLAMKIAEKILVLHNGSHRSGCSWGHIGQNDELEEVPWEETPQRIGVIC